MLLGLDIGTNAVKALLASRSAKVAGKQAEDGALKLFGVFRFRTFDDLAGRRHYLQGDRLIGIKQTDGHGEIVLTTRNGMSIRFKETELRDQGRDTRGVCARHPRRGHIRQAFVRSIR